MGLHAAWLAPWVLAATSLAQAQVYSVTDYTAGVPIGAENWSLSTGDNSVYTVTNKLTGATRVKDMGASLRERELIAGASINGQGEVLFTIQEAGSPVNARNFKLWSASGDTDLPGGTNAYGRFTEKGHVLVTAYNPTSFADTKLYANGSAYAMGKSSMGFTVLPNGAAEPTVLSSFPLDVNASGLVAGVDRNLAALRSPDGTVRYLPGTGTFSGANSINDAGTVVGNGRNAAGQDFAFIWHESFGAARDLNLLIEPPSDLVGQVQLISANDISEDGQYILAYGNDLSSTAGGRKAYLLSAVPEPSTYALMGLGLVGIVLSVRRHHSTRREK